MNFGRDLELRVPDPGDRDSRLRTQLDQRTQGGFPSGLGLGLLACLAWARLIGLAWLYLLIGLGIHR